MNKMIKLTMSAVNGRGSTIMVISEQHATELYNQLKDKFKKEYMKINREKLLEALKVTVVEITFTKKNGDIREMNCTRDPDMIPEDMRVNDKDKTKRAPGPDNIIKVYDLWAEGWRSINIDTVISIDPDDFIEEK